MYFQQQAYCVLLLFTLALAKVFSEATISQEINTYRDSKCSQFSLHVQKIIEKSQIRRIREVKEQYGDARVAQSRGTSLLSPAVAVWFFLEIDSLVYLFAGTKDGFIWLYENSTLIPLLRFSKKEYLIDLKGFKFGNSIWLVGLHHKVQEKIFVQLYQYDFSDLKSRQQILLNKKSIIEVTHSESSWYLIIASDVSTYSELKFFKWSGTQFDNVMSLPVKENPICMSVWLTGQNLNVAASFHKNNLSQVSNFNISNTRKTLTVEILELNCLVMKHFQVKDDHYLVCGFKTRFILYWWNGINLVEQRKISSGSGNIVDIAVLAYTNHTLYITVAKKNLLEFYIQTKSVPLTRLDAINLPVSKTIKSIKLFRKQQEIYLLPVFQHYMKPSIYPIDFDLHSLRVASFINVPILKKCTTHIKPRIQLMKEKLDEIEDKLKFAWMKKDYISLSTVHINGSIFSRTKADIEEISFLDKINVPELLSILDYYKKVKSKISLLKSHLEKTVMQKKTQTINGNIHFSNTVGVMQGIIQKLKYQANLNKINTADLHSALMKNGTQIFMSEVFLFDGSFTTLNTNTLNNVPVSDYITLNESNLIVNGHFSFSHLLLPSINLKEINSLDPKTFFLSSGRQAVMGRKAINHLLCDIISTKNFINGLNITDYAKNTVRIGNMMFKDISLSGIVSILSRLTVKHINGKNLSQLLLSAVRRNENEIIKGKKIFSEPVIVKNVSVLGFINNFNFKNIFTLKTPQKIAGTFIFSKFSTYAVVSNSLNSIDVNQNAVLKSRPTVVKGKVHFLQPPSVLEIIMENNGTINAIKLSKEIPYIPHKNKMVFTNGFLFQNLIVENSVNISESRIGKILFSLNNEVWLKEKFQNVPEGVYRRLVVQDLQTKIINSVSLEDIVLTNSDSNIYSKKVFLNKVYVHSLESTDEKKLINIDDAFVGKNFSFVFNDMIVKGNTDLSGLNKVIISDLMQVEKPQICMGRKDFGSVILKSLNTENLMFSTFNGVNIDHYFLSALMPQKHILNAKFKKIKGIKLVVSSLLNGREFNRFYDSVVTLDSNEKISADLKFSTTLNLEALTASNLIDFNSVVLRDVSNLLISHKEFLRSFSADSMWLEGNINNVSIHDLNVNTFKKNSKNIIQKAITFQSNLSMPSLKVLNATLDHVKFSELLKTQEPLHAEKFRIISANVKNLNVTGQVNECGSFLELLESALLKSKEHKILVNKNFESLSIHGNLHLRNSINGFSTNDINQTLLFLAKENKSNNYIFYNVGTTWLNVLNSINVIDIDFVMNDSVTKDKSQTISGQKKFRSLFLSSLNMSSINANTLCGVDTALLASKYVSKTKRNQKLLLSKLPQMFAKNVIFEKRLNGLKLPEDLIIANQDETIIFPVYFQNLTTLLSDLVIFGSLDKVNVSHLITNKVSLNDFSVLLSDLKFLDHSTILGDMAVRGLVNSLNISDAVKLFGLSVVHSRKAFKKSVFILKITVFGFVNNKSIKAVSQRISKHSEVAANFSKLVQFSYISLLSLTTDDINAVSLSNMWDSIHNVEDEVYASLDEFSEIFDQHNKELFDIEEGVNYNPSIFGFFILHQLLNIGAAVKALPFYEAGVFGSTSDIFSLQIIIWTVQNETCSYYKSTMMDIHPNGTLEKGDTVNGKLFPFTLGLFEENVKGLLFHSDRHISCIGEDKENTIKTIYFNGDTHPNTITSPHNSEVVDAKFIELDIGVFLLVAYNINRDGKRIYLYEHDPFRDTWSIHQKFHSWNISSVDTVYIDDFDSNEIYLAVTGDGTESGIHLYTWDFEESLFDFKFDIPESTAGIVLWVRVDKMVYLLHAEEKTIVQKNNIWIDKYTESVKVYLLDDLDDLIVDHTINIQGISSLEQFKLLGETYVLAVSRHLQMVFVIQHRGFNGFVVIQEISVPGAVNAKTYLTPNQELFVIISSTTGHTRILKSLIRGVGQDAQ